MPKDALTRRRGRRPAGFCQEQTPVLTEQFSSMEHDAFHVSYLSNKIPEAVFHGQAVKTFAYFEGFDRAARPAQPAPRHPRVRTQTRLPHRDFIEATASGQASVGYLTEGTRVNKARIERLLVTTVGDQIRFHKSRLGGLSGGERLWVFPGVFRFQGRNSNLKPSILPAESRCNFRSIMFPAGFDCVVSDDVSPDRSQQLR